LATFYVSFGSFGLRPPGNPAPAVGAADQGHNQEIMVLFQCIDEVLIILPIYYLITLKDIRVVDTSRIVVTVLLYVYIESVISASVS
jgi:hypothetical protein